MVIKLIEYLVFEREAKDASVNKWEINESNRNLF